MSTTATATTATSSTIHDRSVTPARDARRRRLIEGVGFVVVWMALGYTFPGNDLVYLLMGVPLTIAFQVLVRRRPLRELWVRDATRFTLDNRGLVLAAVLLVAPVYFGAQALPGASGWLVGWYAAAIVGAAGAAFALRATTAVAMLRAAMVPMAVGAGGMAAVLGGIHVATGTPVHVLAVLGTVAKYLLLYFPLTFLIEEVAFRGALDAHVHHAGEGRGWHSALLSPRCGDSGTCPSATACRCPFWCSNFWPSTASSGSRCRLPGDASATSPDQRSRTVPSTPSATR